MRKPIRSSVFALAVLSAFNLPGVASALPVGTLALDGAPTPEQISLVLPVVGSLPTTATATVRYRIAGGAWTIGHPLHRVRPDLAENDGPTVEDVFAWPIIDLMPATTYEIEVTVSSGGMTDVKMLTTATRALPPASGAATINVPAGTSESMLASTINNAPAGAVIELANGTYTLTGTTLSNMNGTDNNPIYIRGQSRAGTILSDPSGNVLRIDAMQNMVFERFTIRGSQADGGDNVSSVGVSFSDNVSAPQRRVTFRNLTIAGVDQGIVVRSMIGLQQVLIYDCTLIGNNTWTQDLFSDAQRHPPINPDGTPDVAQSQITWGDDGIAIGGEGNAAFNNTLTGFGDTTTLSAGGEHPTTKGVHFYRNEITMSGDDTFEADYGFRNITFYDNRIRNGATLVSFDPLYGGPALIARNIAINIGRGPYKLNSYNTGHFLYNNLVVRTNGFAGSVGQNWGWNQPNNGDQRAWGYRNNILIYRGTTSGGILRIAAGGVDPVDFDHNAWFPNAPVEWSGGVYASIAAALSSLSPTTPLFSGISRRHTGDVITTSNPFNETITLGQDYRTEVTTSVTPTLAPGSSPKNAGVVIPNITDGYSGSAPDQGPIISGRPVPMWGDRSGTPLAHVPEPPTQLTAN